MSKLFAVLVVSVVLIVAGGNVWAQGGGACDRTCLEGFVDRYLDAAIAHDPKLLPLSRSVKFTENGVRLDVGDAHWKTMTAKGPYRFFVTDPEAEQVAFIGTVRLLVEDPPNRIAFKMSVSDSIHVCNVSSPFRNHQ